MAVLDRKAKNLSNSNARQQNRQAVIHLSDRIRVTKQSTLLLLLPATVQMNFPDVMTIKYNQTQQTTDCMIPFTNTVKNRKTHLWWLKSGWWSCRSMDWEPQLDGGYMGAYMGKNSLSCAFKICVLYMLPATMQFLKNMITICSLSAPFGLVSLATG